MIPKVLISELPDKNSSNAIIIRKGWSRLDLSYCIQLNGGRSVWAKEEFLACTLLSSGKERFCI